MHLSAIYGFGLSMCLFCVSFDLCVFAVSLRVRVCMCVCVRVCMCVGVCMGMHGGGGGEHSSCEKSRLCCYK